MKASSGQLLMGGGVVAGIAAVIAGIVVAGTPSEGRMRRLDRIRSDDLHAIVTSIDAHWERHERLPDSLGELLADPRTHVSIRDPESEQEYEYRVTGEQTYELCGTFALPAISERRVLGPFWAHQAGRQCYPLRAAAP